MTRYRLAVAGVLVLLLTSASWGVRSSVDQEQTDSRSRAPSMHEGVEHNARALNVHYLEVITSSVAETCDALAKLHDVEFTEPIAELGNARTTRLANGGRIGVRAPMHAAERPVVRPYMLVADIQAAVTAAEEAGATVAVPPMEIPGQGTISIVVLAGIEHGLWQN